ncbi:MAG: hypothetical protein IJA10_12585 [Lachnospiraceae bacterium]|nr:hypothetical protein [Lachnospiraceae bacterium]
MAQIQKQKVKLTDLLKETIKDLRKTYNKRGDILSKELDRGASYVSQLENGKIKDIEFDLLNLMFQHIVGLTGNDYNNYIQKYIFEIINNMSSRELLYSEEWIHIFTMQILQIDISDDIIEIIKKKLEQVQYTPEQFVKKINQNIFNRQWFDIKREVNKLYVHISSSNYDNYSTYTDITYSLPEDYVAKILSKEITSISFIFMDGILKNLYTLETDDKAGAIKKTEKILFDNGFFDTIEIFENLHNLSHQQQPLKVDIQDADTDLFTFYDEVIVNYNEKYEKLKQQAIEKLDYAFERYRQEHRSYACETLEKILDNMDGDLGLIMVILSSPLNNIPRDMRHFFWEDCKALIESYLKSKP